MKYYVYIAFSSDKKEVSIGVTVDMHRRMNLLCTQSKKKCRIVYYEEYDNANEANQRYKKLQFFPKVLIIELVDENNPLWVDVLK